MACSAPSFSEEALEVLVLATCCEPIAVLLMYNWSVEFFL